MDNISLKSNQLSRDLQLIQSGTESVEITDFGYQEYEVEHNLGFVPTAIAYFSNPFLEPEYLPFNYFSFVTTSNYQMYFVQISASRIKFVLDIGSGSGSLHFGTNNFKYYLFRGSAR